MSSLGSHRRIRACPPVRVRREGRVRRWICITMLCCLIALAGAARAHDEHTGKCTIAKDESPMSKACAQGGRKAAAREMKRLVKQARAAGMKTKCARCHKDMDTLELERDARDQLRKLLEAVRAG